jgi:hypothetical protein
MQGSLLKPNFPLLLAALAACSSSEIDRESIAGLYGCDPCLLGGSTLYLRRDGTYSRCIFSDTPEFGGHFAKEEQGSYRLEGQQLTLQPESSDKSSKSFVFRIRNRLYMVTEDEYENFQRDYDVIEDVGFMRRPITIDNPYTCEVGRAIQD